MQPRPSGWITQQERQALEGLARGQNCLEVGGWQGLSSTIIGSVAAHLVTVDWWRGDEFTEAVAGPKTRAELFPKWLSNIEAANLEDQVAPFVGDLNRLLPCLAPEHFGLHFFDADHAPKPTLFCLNWCWRGVSMRIEQGLQWAVAVHDYKPRVAKYHATNAAIDEWGQARGLVMERAGSLAIFKGEGGHP